MMFDFNPHIPAFGFNNDFGDSQGPSAQAVNPFVGGSGMGMFGAQAGSPSASKPFNWSSEQDNWDDGSPGWNKRNSPHGFGRHQQMASSPMGGFGLGPMASANSNLFWGQQQANTNPFIFY